MNQAPVKYVSDEERFEFLFVSMILGDPFVHQFVLMMQKFAEKSVKTMGVAIKNAMIMLFYCPEFLNKLTDSEARWVLVHEVLHLVFHHCTLRSSPDPRLHELDNIAADLAINQLIPETAQIRKPRPEIIKPFFPKDLGFPEKLSKEQYYQLLLEKDNKDEKPDYSKHGQIVDSHEGWTDEEAEIIDEIIRDKVEQMSKSDRSWGNVTGGIKEMIMAAQKSQIAWWRILREFLGVMLGTKRESTMKRPNRRFGYPFPGSKRKHVDKVLVGVDDSGSISDESLRKFLSECGMISETHPMDLCTFDTQINQGPMPFTKKRKTFAFEGRGGTSFEPLMELASKGKYKSLIILTDGGAPAPEYPKGVKDVIWCLCEGGELPVGVNWGRVVRIKEKKNFEVA